MLTLFLIAGFWGGYIAESASGELARCPLPIRPHLNPLLNRRHSLLPSSPSSLLGRRRLSQVYDTQHVSPFLASLAGPIPPSPAFAPISPRPKHFLKILRSLTRARRHYGADF